MKEKLSRFLYLFKGKQGTLLAYNGLTNSFLKLNKPLYELLLKAKTDITLLSELDKETYNKLKKAKIITTLEEEQNAITQKKFLRQFTTFNNSFLSLTIAPTSACNFSCPYCFEKGIEHKTMTDEIIEQTINFIVNKSKLTNNKVSITWYGGEPLLVINKITYILDKLRENGVEIVYNGIITNGYLLNKKNIGILKEYGIKFIQITLDGATADSHNKKRFLKNGEGSWDTILSNIDMIIKDKDFKLDTLAIRCNIDKNNEKEYVQLKEKLQKRWNNDKRLFIHPAILQDFNSGNTSIKCKYFSETEASNFIMEQQKREKKIPYFTYTVGGCSATRLYAYLIGPEGELYKCWNDLGRKNRIIGYVYTEKIYNKELLFNYLTYPTMFDDEKCLNCPLFFVCDGGCQYKRIENYKSNKNNNLCHYAIFYLDKYLSEYYELKQNSK